MSRFRRVAAAAGLVLVAACGSDGSDGGGTVAATAETGASVSTTGAGAPVSTTGPAASVTGPVTSGAAGSGPSITGPAGGGTASTSGTSGTTGRSTTSTGTAGSEEGVNDMVVRFEVQGGFANLARSVTISGDGAVTRVRSGQESTGRLSPEEVTAIEQALDGSGLFDRDRKYPAPPGGADLQRYDITYRGHTLVAYDTTVPSELDQAVALLDAATRPA